MMFRLVFCASDANKPGSFPPKYKAYPSFVSVPFMISSALRSADFEILSDFDVVNISVLLLGFYAPKAIIFPSRVTANIFPFAAINLPIFPSISFSHAIKAPLSAN